ncbi:MAG: photosystem II assembly protein Psb34 [Geitlerinemataceae cyanobacterium]
MPYVSEDGGRLNNYAVEPKVYMAEPPTNVEKRNYLILGVGGAVVVAAVVAIAFFASSAAA